MAVGISGEVPGLNCSSDMVSVMAFWWMFLQQGGNREKRNIMLICFPQGEKVDMLMTNG